MMGPPLGLSTLPRTALWLVAASPRCVSMARSASCCSGSALLWLGFALACFVLPLSADWRVACSGVSCVVVPMVWLVVLLSVVASTSLVVCACWLLVCCVWLFGCVLFVLCCVMLQYATTCYYIIQGTTIAILQTACELDTAYYMPYNYYILHPISCILAATTVCYDNAEAQITITKQSILWYCRSANTNTRRVCRVAASGNVISNLKHVSAAPPPMQGLVSGAGRGRPIVCCFGKNGCVGWLIGWVTDWLIAWCMSVTYMYDGVHDYIVWHDITCHAAIWYDMTWNDMAWHGMAWRGMAWHGMAWRDMAWHDMTWYDMTWHDKTWHDMAYHDMTWYGMAWHYMIWYDMLLWYDVTDAYIYIYIYTHIDDAW